MISRKTLKIVMGVSMVLCASASFAARTESIEAALSTDTWYGDIDGARVAGVPTRPAVGYPIADTNHTYVLNVEGSVICSNTTSTTTSTATASVSDFLINIPELSDELEADGLDNAKIAVAAGIKLDGDEIPLMLYCKAGSATAATWVQIATVDSNTWYRVTLVFQGERCRVSLDGEPVKSTHGYATYNGSDANGAWYNLANTPSNPSNLAIGSLSFIGCANLDDVVIKDEFAEDAFPADAVAELEGDETVRYNDLNKWGWTVADLNGKLGEFVLNTGMTVAQKLECGLDPTTGTKFEPVSITKTSADEATITFPCDDSTKMGRYKIVITGGTCNNGSVVTGATTEGCEAGRAKITLSNLNQTAPVMTFKLVAEK